MTYTARLKLPLIHSGQSQKEITHNEALTMLDTIIQPVVQAVNINAPPDEAKTGELYVINANPDAEGEFNNHSNKIATKLEHGWSFTSPLKWMKVTLDADGSEYRFDGDKWLVVPSLSNQPEQIQQSDNYLIKQESGEYLQAVLLQEDLKLQGTYTDTEIKIPHHSIVLAVNIRVIEEIKGAKSFSVGVENEPTKYSSNLSSAKDTTNIGLTSYPTTYWQDTSIRITAEEGSFTEGIVSVSIQLLKPHGPWNWD